MADQTNNGNDRDEEGLAQQLLGGGGQGGGGGELGDVQALGGARSDTRDVREALGLPDLSQEDTGKLVAVSSGTDPAKDDAIVRFLNDHPDIETLKPVVFDKLERLSGSLTAVEAASLLVALGALQGVVDLDTDFAGLAVRVAALLDQDGDTRLTPSLLVSEARLMLSDFLRVSGTQEQLHVTRENKHRRHQQRVDDQAATAAQDVQQREKVGRLRKAAKDGAALPPLKGTRGGKGRKHT